MSRIGTCPLSSASILMRRSLPQGRSLTSRGCPGLCLLRGSAPSARREYSSDTTPTTSDGSSTEASSEAPVGLWNLTFAFAPGSTSSSGSTKIEHGTEEHEHVAGQESLLLPPGISSTPLEIYSQLVVADRHRSAVASASEGSRGTNEQESERHYARWNGDLLLAKLVALRGSRRWQEAFDAMADAVHHGGVKLSTLHYNLALAIAASAESSYPSVLLERHMLEVSEVEPNDQTFAIFIASSMRRGDWANALEVGALYVEEGREMTRFVMSLLSRAQSYAPRQYWSKALSMLWNQRGRSCPVSVAQSRQQQLTDETQQQQRQRQGLHLRAMGIEHSENDKEGAMLDQGYSQTQREEHRRQRERGPSSSPWLSPSYHHSQGVATRGREADEPIDSISSSLKKKAPPAIEKVVSTEALQSVVLTLVKAHQDQKVIALFEQFKVEVPMSEEILATVRFATERSGDWEAAARTTSVILRSEGRSTLAQQSLFSCMRTMHSAKVHPHVVQCYQLARSLSWIPEVTTLAKVADCAAKEGLPAVAVDALQLASQTAAQPPALLYESTLVAIEESTTGTVDDQREVFKVLLYRGVPTTDVVHWSVLHHQAHWQKALEQYSLVNDPDSVLICQVLHSLALNARWMEALQVLSGTLMNDHRKPMITDRLTKKQRATALAYRPKKTLLSLTFELALAAVRDHPIPCLAAAKLAAKHKAKIGDIERIFELVDEKVLSSSPSEGSSSTPSSSSSSPSPSHQALEEEQRPKALLDRGTDKNRSATSSLDGDRVLAMHLAAEAQLSGELDSDQFAVFCLETHQFLQQYRQLLSGAAVSHHQLTPNIVAQEAAIRSLVEPWLGHDPFAPLSLPGAHHHSQDLYSLLDLKLCVLIHLRQWEMIASICNRVTTSTTCTNAAAAAGSRSGFSLTSHLMRYAVRQLTNQNDAVGAMLLCSCGPFQDLLAPIISPEQHRNAMEPAVLDEQQEAVLKRWTQQLLLPLLDVGLLSYDPSSPPGGEHVEAVFVRAQYLRVVTSAAEYFPSLILPVFTVANMIPLLKESRHTSTGSSHSSALAATVDVLFERWLEYPRAEGGVQGKARRGLDPNFVHSIATQLLPVVVSSHQLAPPGVSSHQLAPPHHHQQHHEGPKAAPPSIAMRLWKSVGKELFSHYLKSVRRIEAEMERRRQSPPATTGTTSRSTSLERRRKSGRTQQQDEEEVPLHLNPLVSVGAEPLGMNAQFDPSERELTSFERDTASATSYHQTISHFLRVVAEEVSSSQQQQQQTAADVFRRLYHIDRSALTVEHYQLWIQSILLHRGGQPLRKKRGETEGIQSDRRSEEEQEVVAFALSLRGLGQRQLLRFITACSTCGYPAVGHTLLDLAELEGSATAVFCNNLAGGMTAPTNTGTVSTPTATAGWKTLEQAAQELAGLCEKIVEGSLIARLVSLFQQHLSNEIAKAPSLRTVSAKIWFLFLRPSFVVCSRVEPSIAAGSIGGERLKDNAWVAAGALLSCDESNASRLTGNSLAAVVAALLSAPRRPSSPSLAPSEIDPSRCVDQGKQLLAATFSLVPAVGKFLQCNRIGQERLVEVVLPFTAPYEQLVRVGRQEGQGQRPSSDAESALSSPSYPWRAVLPLIENRWSVALSLLPFLPTALMSPLLMTASELRDLMATTSASTLTTTTKAKDQKRGEEKKDRFSSKTLLELICLRPSLAGSSWSHALFASECLMSLREDDDRCRWQSSPPDHSWAVGLRLLNTAAHRSGHSQPHQDKKQRYSHTAICGTVSSRFVRQLLLTTDNREQNQTISSPLIRSCVPPRNIQLQFLANAVTVSLLLLGSNKRKDGQEKEKAKELPLVISWDQALRTLAPTFANQDLEMGEEGDGEKGREGQVLSLMVEVMLQSPAQAVRLAALDLLSTTSSSRLENRLLVGDQKKPEELDQKKPEELLRPLLVRTIRNDVLASNNRAVIVSAVGLALSVGLFTTKATLGDFTPKTAAACAGRAHDDTILGPVDHLRALFALHPWARTDAVAAGCLDHSISALCELTRVMETFAPTNSSSPPLRWWTQRFEAAGSGAGSRPTTTGDTSRNSSPSSYLYVGVFVRACFTRSAFRAAAEVVSKLVRDREVSLAAVVNVIVCVPKLSKLHQFEEVLFLFPLSLSSSSSGSGGLNPGTLSSSSPTTALTPEVLRRLYRHLHPLGALEPNRLVSYDSSVRDAVRYLIEEEGISPSELRGVLDCKRVWLAAAPAPTSSGNRRAAADPEGEKAKGKLKQEETQKQRTRRFAQEGPSSALKQLPKDHPDRLLGRILWKIAVEGSATHSGRWLLALEALLQAATPPNKLGMEEGREEGVGKGAYPQQRMHFDRTLREYDIQKAVSLLIPAVGWSLAARVADQHVRAMVSLPSPSLVSPSFANPQTPITGSSKQKLFAMQWCFELLKNARQDPKARLTWNWERALQCFLLPIQIDKRQQQPVISSQIGSSNGTIPVAHFFLSSALVREHGAALPQVHLLELLRQTVHHRETCMLFRWLYTKHYLRHAGISYCPERDDRNEDPLAVLSKELNMPHPAESDTPSSAIHPREKSTTTIQGVFYFLSSLRCAQLHHDRRLARETMRQFVKCTSVFRAEANQKVWSAYVNITLSTKTPPEEVEGFEKTMKQQHRLP